MKKLFLGSLFAFLFIFVAGCSTKNNEEKKDKFTISYVDYLGNTTSKDYELGSFDNPLEALKEGFDVIETGGYITSINNSFNDYNWAIMVYENGISVSVGANDLVIDKDDTFEFRHECWNTVESGWGIMDSYDVLVDKVIYYYAQTKLTETLSSLTEFDATSSTYWEMMALKIMIDNNYDANIFNTDIIKDSYKTSLTNYNYQTLSGNDLMKYMRASRLFSISSGLKEHYKNVIEDITVYNEWDEFSLPLLISMAKSLELESSLDSSLINTDYTPSLEYGTDGLVEFVLGHSLYKSYDDSVMDNFKNITQNGASTSLELLIYAAFNKNARSESLDIIKYLIDEFMMKI